MKHTGWMNNTVKEFLISGAVSMTSLVVSNSLRDNFQGKMFIAINDAFFDIINFFYFSTLFLSSIKNKISFLSFILFLTKNKLFSFILDIRFHFHSFTFFIIL